jgi:hypothetical protein
MFKTISAALLAASMLAAPAFAATGKVTHAPAAKVNHIKPGVLNANAKMEKQHLHHHRHHRHHVAAVRTHRHAKVSFHHAAPTKTRRG